MKRLEYLFLFGLSSLALFKGLNHFLLKTFFQNIQIKLKLIQSHRNLSKQAQVVQNKSSISKVEVPNYKLQVLYNNDGLIRWHTPLISQYETYKSWHKQEVLKECFIEGHCTNKRVNVLLMSQSINYLLNVDGKYMDKQSKEDQTNLEDLYIKYLITDSLKLQKYSYFQSYIRLVKTLEDDQIILQFENQEQLKRAMKRSLPEQVLVFPHDRLRNVVIDEQGLIQTQQSSTDLYFTQKKQDRIILSKVMDPWQKEDYPKDIYLKSLLKEFKTQQIFIYVQAFLESLQDVKLNTKSDKQQLKN